MKRTLWFFLMCASSLMLASAAVCQTPQDGEKYEAEVKKVLEKLPAGTRHEFVMMPMRDGVKLATDIFIPDGAGPWPVALLRTPYSRFDPRVYTAMEGVPSVTVLQNQRGRYGSEGAGTFNPLDALNEVDDGYDCIEWIAKQPWCNGKVAMWGPSGHGVSPTNALWSLAPHLTLVNTNVTGDNLYLYWMFSNGARRQFYSWIGQRGGRFSDWPKPTIVQYDVEKYWKFVKERAEKCEVFYRDNAGWFDLFSEAALDHFALLAPKGRSFVKVGPSGHGAIGGLKFPSAQYPYDAVKGVPSVKEILTGSPGQEKSVLVYYLMGDAKDPQAPGNRYMVSNVWPVPSTAVSYYLARDGSLSLSAPTQKDASLTFLYDPKNPVPSLGGNWAIGEKSGPHDQRQLKDRTDILRFATEPLAEPVGITGKVWVELYVSSDAPDTMFTVKLIDIYPDGYEAVFRESAGLARYWNGLDKPAKLEAGKVYRLKLDCWSTALVFNKGHRIGLHISSSSTPAYEVHPNTYDPVASEAEMRVARNTVHMSEAYPSRLILPVVPKESYITQK